VFGVGLAFVGGRPLDLGGLPRGLFSGGERFTGGFCRCVACSVP
jgi:hypothetical protein